MAELQIRRSDGTVDKINIPDYALDTTVAKLQGKLSEMQITSKKSDKRLGNIDHLLRSLLKGDKDATSRYIAKLDEIDKKNAQRQRKAQQQSKEQHQEAEESKKQEAEKTRITLRDGLAKSDAILSKLTMVSMRGLSAITGVFATTVGLLTGHAMALGDTAADMAKSGVGFDMLGDTVTGTMQSFNQMGITTAQAAEYMKSFSNVVAVTGRTSFVNATKELNKLTKGGSELGMTMGEMVSLLGDQMGMQQGLGVLEKMDAKKEAERAKQLQLNQLEYSRRLGVDIKYLADAINATVESTDFMLDMQLIAARQGPEAAREMLAAVQDSMAELRGSGMSQALIDRLGQEATGAGALISEGGQELFKAFQAIGGKEGQALNKTMSDYRNAMQSGNPKAIAAATDAMTAALGDLGDDLGNNPVREQQLKMLAKTNPALGELINSAIQAKQAMKDEAKQRQTSGQTISNLAKTAKQYEQAMAEVAGGFSSLSTAMAGAFSGLMQGFATALSGSNEAILEAKIKIPESLDDIANATGKQKEAYDKNLGVMHVFQLAISEVGKAFSSALGLAGDDTKGLADSIRKKLIPFITEAAKTLKENAGTIVNAFRFMGGIISGVASAFTSLAGYVWKAISPIIKFFSSTEKAADGVEKTVTQWGDFGVTIGKTIAAIVGLKVVIGGVKKAFLLYQGAMAAKSAVQEKGLLGAIKDKLSGGGGGAASAASRTTQAGAGGALANAAGGGKGKGKGFLDGLIDGMKKLGGVPFTALLKASLVIGVLTLAAMGLAKAVDIAKDAFPMFGEMVKKILEGIAPVILSFGQAFKSVLEGIAPVMAAFGQTIKSVLEGILPIVGTVFKGIGSILSGFGDLVVNIGAAVAGVFIGIGEGVQRVGSGIADVFNSISGVIGSVTGLITGTIDSFTDGITQMASVDVTNLFLLGPALASVAAGLAGLSVGGVISGAVDGLMSLFGADSPFDKVAKIGEAAPFIVAMGKTMDNFGNTVKVFNSALKDLDTGQFEKIAKLPIDDMVKAAQPMLTLTEAIQKMNAAMIESGEAAPALDAATVSWKKTHGVVSEINGVKVPDVLLSPEQISERKNNEDEGNTAKSNLAKMKSMKATAEKMGPRNKHSVRSVQAHESKLAMYDRKIAQLEAIIAKQDKEVTLTPRPSEMNAPAQIKNPGAAKLGLDKEDRSLDRLKKAQTYKNEVIGKVKPNAVVEEIDYTRDPEFDRRGEFIGNDPNAVKERKAEITREDIESMNAEQKATFQKMWADSDNNMTTEEIVKAVLESSKKDKTTQIASPYISNPSPNKPEAVAPTPVDSVKENLEEKRAELERRLQSGDPADIQAIGQNKELMDLLRTIAENTGSTVKYTKGVQRTILNSDF